MPLRAGKSRQVFSSNVKELVKSGRPLKQALAIAYSKKRAYGKGKKKKMMPMPTDMQPTPMAYPSTTASMMAKKFKKKGKKTEKNSLYKNIREKAAYNRKMGKTPKKPTAQMLAQEKKIKLETMAKSAKSKSKMVLKKKMGKACKKCSKKMTKGYCPSCK